MNQRVYLCSTWWKARHPWLPWLYNSEVKKKEGEASRKRGHPKREKGEKRPCKVAVASVNYGEKGVLRPFNLPPQAQGGAFQKSSTGKHSSCTGAGWEFLQFCPILQVFTEGSRNPCFKTCGNCKAPLSCKSPTLKRSVCLCSGLWAAVGSLGWGEGWMRSLGRIPSMGMCEWQTPRPGFYVCGHHEKKDGRQGLNNHPENHNPHSLPANGTLSDFRF